MPYTAFYCQSIARRDTEHPEKKPVKTSVEK